uniref:SEC31 homolog B, COPII coat complex component n=1 Tax=Astyanax mexicanus TaxID=7994 RepID=A0A8B9HV71_ASTMX
YYLAIILKDSQGICITSPFKLMQVYNLQSVKTEFCNCDVCVVAWNKQVQHILASAGPSGRAVVWDLRKNEPIIKISDHSNRMHCSGMLWHPEVATQMILASEDDRLPVIQMWDLRFATSPLKVFENHTRGILSVSWSRADPELLLSSAKDNRILCWNPNTAEVTYELPTANQWCFDVQWCPRNPALLSAASFDGHISVYTVMGGCLEAQQYSTVDKVIIIKSLTSLSLSLSLFYPVYLQVNFEDEARVKFLRLLGFSKDELEKKISSSLGKKLQPNGHGLDINDLTEKMQTLSAQRADDESGTVTPPTDFFSQIQKEKTPFHIPVSADTDGLISQALLVGNFEGAVDLCLSDGRYAEAILLSISGGEELLKKTQQKYLSKQTNQVSMLISSVVTQNWRDIVQACDLDNWREALAALLTYANPEEFAPLCDTLGSRLEAGGTEKRCLQACLCYICSGNIHRLVECWSSQRDCTTPLTLEDLVEKVMVLRKSIERLRNSEVTVQSSALEEKLIHYANLLANQGSLETALSYLPQKSQQVHTHTCGPFPPAAPTQMPQAGQPAMPPMFTPQVPPTTHTPGVPRPSSRPAYPQYPAAASGFMPSQPVGGSLMFPPSSLSGPVPPPSTAPAGMVPMMPMMPTPPPPGFLPSTSMPPIPPTSLPGGPVPMFSGPSGSSVPQSIAPPHLGTAPPPLGTAAPPAGMGYPQGGPGAPGAKTYTPSVPPPPTGAHDGWNDPPAVRSGPRSKKVAGDYTPPAPITAPVMSLPAEGAMPQDRVQVPPGAPQEPSLQVLQQLPADRVEQKEIPAEHVILKTTFDSLVQRCQLAATDPQTKRKLDDASKRIGSLYDKLREHAVRNVVLTKQAKLNLKLFQKPQTVLNTSL